jgi:hypothetical protein
LAEETATEGGGEGNAERSNCVDTSETP